MNYVPLASIKRLFSVPSYCVLPEDMVSGLAMHGKPVALSWGATTLGIRAALTVGHARLRRVNRMLVYEFKLSAGSICSWLLHCMHSFYFYANLLMVVSVGGSSAVSVPVAADAVHIAASPS